MIHDIVKEDRLVGLVSEEERLSKTTEKKRDTAELETRPPIFEELRLLIEHQQGLILKLQMENDELFGLYQQQAKQIEGLRQWVQLMEPTLRNYDLEGSNRNRINELEDFRDNLRDCLRDD